MLGDLLGELATAVFGIFLIAWWLGGPAVTAIIWSEGDKEGAVQILAAWAIITTLYLTASWMIRRARRAG
ncbi:hypothetical protein [Streptomyces poonensis]|uniref:hypothetical protein n=1 Tax=Streptomyces poonensis TaxID=68255 RepID=UPI0022F33B31|nr:hypothetical protein [Streptomyces poonensis]